MASNAAGVKPPSSQWYGGAPGPRDGLKDPPAARTCPSVAWRTVPCRTLAHKTPKASVGSDTTDQDPSRVITLARWMTSRRPPRTTIVASGHESEAAEPDGASVFSLGTVET